MPAPTRFSETSSPSARSACLPSPERPDRPMMPQYPPARGLLKGKSVLVTAAAETGIGFATAKRCAEEGARLFVSDIHERRLNEAVEKLAPLCAEKPKSVLCDVSREDDVARMFAQA